MKRYLLDSNAVTSLINKREPLTQRVREARQRGCRCVKPRPIRE